MVKRSKVARASEPSYREVVEIPWGGGKWIRGLVDEVYGPEERRQVVVLLNRKVSGYVVDEPTTVVWPVAEVKRITAPV